MKGQETRPVVLRGENPLSSNELRINMIIKSTYEKSRNDENHYGFNNNDFNQYKLLIINK